MPGCPTPDVLEEFVRDGAESDELFEHIENCEDCGRIIEKLCNSTDHNLSPTNDTPSLSTIRPEDREFLNRLAQCPPDFCVNDQPQVGIQFPATAPGFMGTLDCYQIVRSLDSGGFGEVFEAIDTQLNRTVALKLMRVKGCESADLVRFQREAHAAGSIHHENVVILHRVLEPTQEFPYACLVMEYVRGGSLKHRIETDESLEIEQIVRWMIQAADGLSAVHDGGLLHRDLKPANLLIDDAGTLKLGDFGLARPLFGDAQVSINVAGTPAYMSPEQILTPERLTVHSDIYGLGVVLYQLLTGVRPFQGKGEGLRKQIIESAPPAIRELNPRVSRDLETICLRCLHKDPSRRFESAQALAQDLQNCLAGRPISSRPVGQVERAYWWARRHPTLTTVLVGSILVAIATSLAAWKFEVLRDQALQAQGKEAVAKEVAIASKEQTSRAQAESLQTLGFLVTQLSDQVGDHNRQAIIFEHFVERLENTVSTQALDPLRTVISAQSHMILAMTYDSMKPTLEVRDNVSKASRHYGAAVALLEPVADTEGRLLLSAYDSLGANYQKQGDLHSADVYFHKALTLAKELQQKQPEDLELLRSESVVYESLAVNASRQGNPAKRIEHLQACLRIREQLVKANAESDKAKHELAGVLVLLGDAVREQKPDQAAEVYTRAIGLSEAVVSHDPQNIAFQRTLANSFDRMSRCVTPAAALEWSRKSLIMREKINRLDPLSRTSLNDLLVSYIGILQQSDDLSDAESMLDLASEQAERWLSLDSRDPQAINFVARLSLEYCRWYDQRNEHKTALTYAQKAVDLRRQSLQQNPTAAARKSLVVALKSLADIKFALNQDDDAMTIVDEQMSILKQMIEAHENEEEMRQWLKDIQQLKSAAA